LTGPGKRTLIPVGTANVTLSARLAVFREESKTEPFMTVYLNLCLFLTCSAAVSRSGGGPASLA
jgi:hypothetical protein